MKKVLFVAVLYSSFAQAQTNRNEPFIETSQKINEYSAYETTSSSDKKINELNLHQTELGEKALPLSKNILKLGIATEQKFVSDNEKLVAEGKKFFGFHPSIRQSILLYGRLNIYHAQKVNMSNVIISENTNQGSIIGMKGWEDLSKGYSAIFNIECTLKADTGDGILPNNEFGFDRAAFLGLVTPYGVFRLGRSGSPFATLVFGNGYDIGIGRGVGILTGSLPGAGIDRTHPEISPIFSNGLYWDAAFGQLQFGAAITTKGDQYEGLNDNPELPIVNNEGQKNTKNAYGYYLLYKNKVGPLDYSLGGAFQIQNGTSYPNNNKPKFANGEAKNGWIIALSLKKGPIRLKIAHNQNLLDNQDVANTGTLFPSDPIRYGHSRSTALSLGWQFNPMDYIYLTAGIYKRYHSLEFFPSSSNIVSFLMNQQNAITGSQKLKGTQISLGYEHSLSKRTAVYTNLRKANFKQSCTLNPINNNYNLINKLACQSALDTVNKKLVGEVGYGYDIGISHTF